MADDTDVITLDSDDEDTSNSSLPNANNGIAIKRVTGGITHGSPGSAIRLPLPPNLRTSSPGVSGRQIMSGSPRKQVPRKPGVFPPFALFSQEHRAEVVASQENIGFGDVGRKLGEMWHSLSEDQKENYRRRAREISDQKMAEYQASLSKMSPQQRQMAIRQANTPSQKKRRTHGYAIFSAEMRKNLGQAMNPQETANVIAESWRSASPSVRRDYEERAARVNAAQLRRIAPGPVPSVQPQSSQQQRIQYAQSAASNGTGLRISSVSSLSPQTKKPPSQLGPRLPSGITISRVEPDISIVSEQIPQRLVAQTPPRFPPTVQHTTGTRGRPPARKPTMSPAAQAAMRVKAQLRAQQQSQGGYNGHTQWNAQVIITSKFHEISSLNNALGVDFKKLTLSVIILSILFSQNISLIYFEGSYSWKWYGGKTQRSRKRFDVWLHDETSSSRNDGHQCQSTTHDETSSNAKQDRTEIVSQLWFDFARWMQIGRSARNSSNLD